MHLSIPTLVLALASLAASQNPTPGFDVITSPPNQATYQVRWAIPIISQDSLKSGNITLTLIGGPDPSNLSPVMTIACTYLDKLFLFSPHIKSIKRAAQKKERKKERKRECERETNKAQHSRHPKQHHKLGLQHPRRSRLPTTSLLQHQPNPRLRPQDLPILAPILHRC
jgi:hypothetical protein